MQYSQARQGRIFIIRLENGEILHKILEKFALDQDIRAASVIIVGGANVGSRIIVGPEDGKAKPVVPMEYILDNVHEITGVGTIFPDNEGRPILHMHVACGRLGSSVTGCVRNGVVIWEVVEVILIELLDTTAVRRYETETGFKLLGITKICP